MDSGDGRFSETRSGYSSQNDLSQQIKKSGSAEFLLPETVEHRRFELLTPTLPVSFLRIFQIHLIPESLI
jgi:hypothetical protein